MAAASILISEAEPSVRRVLTVLVERLGHRAAVLERTDAVPPRADVLLVDPLAPDGIEHACLVRKFRPETAIVLLNPPPDGAGCLHAAHVLPKPFGLDELGAALERALPT